MYLFLSNIPVPVYPDTDDEHFIVIVIVTMYCVKSCVHESFVMVWQLFGCVLSASRIRHYYSRYKSSRAGLLLK